MEGGQKSGAHCTKDKRRVASSESDRVRGLFTEGFLFRRPNGDEM